MHCTHCGSQMGEGEKFCPGCGAAVGSAARAAEKRKAKGNPATGCLAIGVLAVLAYVAFGTGGDKKDAAAPVMTPGMQAVVDAKAKRCDELIEQATAAKLIMGRPEPNRVNVEDQLWAAMPADSKTGLAATVRCSLLRGKDSEDLGDYAVVYGYRSGKRLAMATANGVSLD